MEKVLTAKQMKAADTYTSEQIGIPSMVLMERAALALAGAACLYAGERDLRIVVVCGSGNNGGDGYAAARLLKKKYPRTKAFFAGNAEHLSAQCAQQRSIYRALGGEEIAGEVIPPCDILIDALFGIGLSRPIEGRTAQLIEQINGLDAYIISADIPSGVDANNGCVLGTAVRADETVSFQFLKRGLLLYPGANLSGKVSVPDVGIVLGDADLGNAEVCGEALERGDVQEMLPPRTRRSNKGMYGRAAIIAGSRNMSGCAQLATEAAMRMGTGLVMGISPEDNREILQSGVPEALYRPTAQAFQHGWERWATALAIGPGIGTGSDAYHCLQTVLEEYNGPMVLDADALNLIAADESGFLLDKLRRCAGRTILTPHPGEMGRLCGERVSRILSDPVAWAQRLAQKTGSVVVLKDATTIITDGRQLRFNRSGCDGMAAGGSGDVLTGVICGLCAQGVPVFEAASLGVYIHGLAGEAAEAALGARGMSAGDITRYIPSVIR